ncbi:MAG TPA: DoxX family protein [Burkholderiales bacterium]
MAESKVEKSLIVFFRVTMAWVFLYASSHQLFDPKFSAGGFLAHTKTFHDFFAYFATPAMLPVTDFLVQWGHFLIGLSLLTGFMVRLSAPFGILLMLTYWFAHMDFPFVDNKLNFIFDYHLVYAGVLTYLIAKHAGHVLGLDGVVANFKLTQDHPRLAALVS